MLQVNISLWEIVKCNSRKHKNTQHCFSNHSKSNVKNKVATLMLLKLTTNTSAQEKGQNLCNLQKICHAKYTRQWRLVGQIVPAKLDRKWCVWYPGMFRSLTLGLFYVFCLVWLAPAVPFSVAASALNPQVTQRGSLWTWTLLNWIAFFLFICFLFVPLSSLISWSK